MPNRNNSRNIRILAVTPLYPPFLGGIEVFVDALSRKLLPSIETVVITDSGKNESYSDVVNGAQVHRFPMSRAIMSRSAGEPLAVLQAVRQVLAAVQPDIIHLHSATQAGVFFIDRLLQRMPQRPPVVITQHAMLAEADELGVTRRLLKEADVVTGVSDAVLDCAIEYSGRTGRSEMIFNGVRSPETPQPVRAMPARHRLLCVGRMQREKGFDLAVEALAMVRAQGIDAELSLIGGGDEQPLFDRLGRTLGISEHVHFLGPMTNAAARQVMAESSILLMPSRLREGFGLVAAEAAFAGTPCIASRTGGLPEVVQDGETGYLVEEEDVEGLAAAIASLLQDEPRWRRLSDNARERAPGRFDLDRCIQRYADLYQSLMGAENPQ
ncbi:MAG: glycosyltransferase family 4 protein [Devosia sp.]|nr:glycosyltransferase family 4 protein [Devosia sp.]